VSKEFGLEKAFGQGAARHFDERLISPGRAVMDRAGDERFARAALTGHEDRCSTVGHRADEVEDLQHLVVVPDDVLQAEA
jgi:hypothetical protein